LEKDRRKSTFDDQEPIKPESHEQKPPQSYQRGVREKTLCRNKIEEKKQPVKRGLSSSGGSRLGDFAEKDAFG